MRTSSRTTPGTLSWPRKIHTGTSQSAIHPCNIKSDELVLLQAMHCFTGYALLYRDLDLLPDIAIAEEARASPYGGEIFKYIASRPTRYAVLDDYTRTIRDAPLAGACLDGDTAVFSTLECRRSLVQYLSPGESWYFDLTEDGSIDDHDSYSNYYSGTLKSNEAWLLHSPLPFDLPAVNKDTLILMAAYEGHLDRYARLCRPKLVQNEGFCVVWDIYHSTASAKWWSLPMESRDLRCNLPPGVLNVP